RLSFGAQFLSLSLGFNLRLALARLIGSEMLAAGRIAGFVRLLPLIGRRLRRTGQRLLQIANLFRRFVLEILAVEYFLEGFELPRRLIQGVLRGPEVMPSDRVCRLAHTLCEILQTLTSYISAFLKSGGKLLKSRFRVLLQIGFNLPNLV